MVRRITGIYALKNTVNGKIYIGQSVSVLARRQAHFSMLRRGVHFNKHLQASWNKYGENSFEWRILVECSEDTLDTQESEYIKILRSRNSAYGYNGWEGGHKNRSHSEETRRKISKSLTGKKLSPEHCKSISLARIGNPRSPETRAKLSAAALGRKISQEQRLRISAALKGKPWASKRRSHALAKATENWQLVLPYLSRTQGISSGELAEAVGWSKTKTSKKVVKWVIEKKLVMVDPNAAPKLKKYVLPV